MTRYRLAGDLGGTKTILALAEVRAGKNIIVREQRFVSTDYPSFEQLLAEFLSSNDEIESACFGLAGPTDGHTARLTYLPWQLESKALTERFKLGSTRLINDFAAAAYGIAMLDPLQLQTIQPGQPRPQAPRLIIGAGTGLGVAGLIWQAGQYTPIAGEGGHLGFAPQSAQQSALWHHIFTQRGRVTAEDVLGGEGLCQIYAFLGGDRKTPAEIGDAGINGRDPRATQTLELWLSLYGAFAGDQALAWLPYGGVYIAGGLAAKLMPSLRLKPFLEAFRAKRKHRALVEAIPVHLVREERLGLLGALAQVSPT